MYPHVDISGLQWAQISVILEVGKSILHTSITSTCISTSISTSTSTSTSTYTSTSTSTSTTSHSDQESVILQYSYCPWRDIC